MSSERQEATKIEDVRVDHLNRYAWASEYLPAEGRILDAFCGVGYGTAMLAMKSAERRVVGLDASFHALEAAEANFKKPNTFFEEFKWPHDTLPIQSYAGVVSLESIEHVDDPLKLFTHLAQALEIDGVLVFSTPNGNELIKTHDTFPHHTEHWPLETALQLATATIEDHHRHDNVQLELIDWAGQDVYHVNNGRVTGLLEPEQMIIKPNAEGQFTLVACRRIS